MPQFVAKRQEEIFADMQAQVAALCGLSDITDSSGLKSVLQAFARQLDEANYNAALLRQSFSLDTAQGSDLDLRAQELNFRPRLGAVAATGFVIFSRPDTAGDVVIPMGTLVQAVDGTTFRTAETRVLSQQDPPAIPGHTTGQDSGSVPVVATDAGQTGNLAAQTLTVLADTLGGINQVTNPAATVGGQDSESDDAYRAACYGYVQSLSRSTPQALVAQVLGQQDPETGRTIVYAQTLSDVRTPGRATLLIDDGTGDVDEVLHVDGEVLTQGMDGPPPNTAVGGEMRLQLAHYPVVTEAPVVVTSSARGQLTADTDYLLTPSYGQVLMTGPLAAGEAITASYSYHGGLIALAQKIVDGDPQDPQTYPGCRAYGVVVTVAAPQSVTLDVQATLTIAPGYDPVAAQAQVQSALTRTINTLGIGADVLRAQLIAAAMAVPGVSNVVLTSPAQDLAVLDDQIARIAQNTVVVG